MVCSSTFLCNSFCGLPRRTTFSPGSLLHLLHDDLFQLGSLRLGTGYDGQKVQVLGHRHFFSAGQNSGVVDPALRDIQIGATELAAQIFAVAVGIDIRHDHAFEFAVKEAIEGDGQYL